MRADNPSLSFTTRVHGMQNIATRTAVLNGIVIDGWLTGMRVHVALRAVECTEAPDGTCYHGTITVRRADSGT